MADRAHLTLKAQPASPKVGTRIFSDVALPSRLLTECETPLEAVYFCLAMIWSLMSL